MIFIQSIFDEIPAFQVSPVSQLRSRRPVAVAGERLWGPRVVLPPGDRAAQQQAGGLEGQGGLEPELFGEPRILAFFYSGTVRDMQYIYIIYMYITVYIYIYMYVYIYIVYMYTTFINFPGLWIQWWVFDDRLMGPCSSSCTQITGSRQCSGAATTSVAKDFRRPVTDQTAATKRCLYIPNMELHRTFTYFCMSFTVVDMLLGRNRPSQSLWILSN